MKAEYTNNELLKAYRAFEYFLQLNPQGGIFYYGGESFIIKKKIK